jgi:hypothetical protein
MPSERERCRPHGPQPRRGSGAWRRLQTWCLRCCDVLGVRGKLRERAQLTREEGESFERARGRRNGSLGQLYVSMPGKGLGGTLDCRRGPN